MDQDPLAIAPIAASAIARTAVTKMWLRILPLLGLGYLVAYMDRVNISFAALQMNADLGFSATIYGLGGGLFFLAYAIFEVPSSLLLSRFGARRWIARIMITWGLLAAGMMFVRTPVHFYILRFLLGMAEAGFFPCAIYYLSHWFPRACRGRAFSLFYLNGAITSIVMGAISGALLGLDGHAGLRGWQWLFLAQGLPATLIGLLVLRFLPDEPATAQWLTDPERAWLTDELARDAARIGEPTSHGVLNALRHPRVLQLGLLGCLSIGPFITFTLSAPLFLREATGMDATHVGYLISVGGVLGVFGMLFAGWFSDRRGERFTVLLIATAIVGAAYVAFGLVSAPALVMAVYLAFATAWAALTVSQVMIWPDVLHVRLLAVGGAAINTMAQLGAFALPYAWGAAKDATGNYRAGLFCLAAITLALLGLTAWVREQVRPPAATLLVGGCLP